MNYYELNARELEAVRNLSSNELVAWLKDHTNLTSNLQAAELEIDQEIGNPISGARIAYD